MIDDKGPDTNIGISNKESTGTKIENTENGQPQLDSGARGGNPTISENLKQLEGHQQWTDNKHGQKEGEMSWRIARRFFLALKCHRKC